MAVGLIEKFVKQCYFLTIVYCNSQDTRRLKRITLYSSEQMVTIWNEEKRHIQCIQDPPGTALYTVTGHTTKGKVQLPVFRCARGTTLLESFHLHLAR